MSFFKRSDRMDDIEDGVQVASRKNNAPDVLQARSIENFWAIYTKEYKKLNKQLKQLVKNFEKVSKISGK